MEEDGERFDLPSCNELLIVLLAASCYRLRGSWTVSNLSVRLRPCRSFVGCKTVANMIKGKSVEEIRKTFNIVNDFTPEEEEQIRKENGA